MKTLRSMTSVANTGRLLPWATLVVVLLAGAACQNQGVGRLQLELSGEAQGTYYRILYYDDQGRNFRPEVEQILHEVDMSASVHVPNSVISRVNRNETDVVDEIFAENFRMAWKVSEATDGAFDCTIGQLIEAWGWGFSQRDQITQELIDSLRHLTGYKRVRLENNRLYKEDSLITINFNAIAKGYTCDLIANMFLENGVENFLIDIGGELVAHGKKPGRSFWQRPSLWTVGVELPDDRGDVMPDNLMERPVRALLRLTDIGIATSGNYRKFYLEDGVKYSHTIDPTTGFPVKHSMLSATVLAESAAVADAWATAFMVLGPERSKEMLKELDGIEAYFIYSDEEGNDKTWFSPGMADIVQEL